MSKFNPYSRPTLSPLLHNLLSLFRHFVPTFGPFLLNLISINRFDLTPLHFTSTFILLRLQHYSHFPSNITPHCTPNLLTSFHFNYSPLSHHILFSPLYSTHTNTHNNTIVILIAPRHFHFSYCSSHFRFSPHHFHFASQLLQPPNTHCLYQSGNYAVTFCILLTLSYLQLHFLHMAHMLLFESTPLFTTPTPFFHTLFLHNCSPFHSRSWCKSYRFCIILTPLI